MPVSLGQIDSLADFNGDDSSKARQDNGSTIYK